MIYFIHLAILGLLVFWLGILQKKINQLSESYVMKWTIHFIQYNFKLLWNLYFLAPALSDCSIQGRLSCSEGTTMCKRNIGRISFLLFVYRFRLRILYCQYTYSKVAAWHTFYTQKMLLRWISGYIWVWWLFFFLGRGFSTWYSNTYQIIILRITNII